MFKTHNIITIGFPLYLIIFEFVLRSILDVDTQHFIPPTLAASGLVLLIGALKPKEINLAEVGIEMKETDKIKTVVRNVRDEKIIQITWALILAELLTWYYCCALVIKLEKNNNLHVISPSVIGYLNYLVAVIIVSIKEAQK